MTSEPRTYQTSNARPPSIAPESLPVYVAFGKFQLLARLGKGGMGDVFLASVKGMQGFNKLVVVKRLRESLAEDADMRELFLAEGRLAARLNHPSVVQTNEVGEEQGTLYLSMEYLEGQPLSEINRKLGSEPLDPILAARIVSESLAGLHYAHELRDYDGTALHLVHRDISPQNIFITYDGATKVVDFGVAKVAWQVSSKTQDGVLKGKVAYMAPEQVAGSPDRRSDIFSMGIVLWELIVRKRLLSDSSVARVLHRVINENQPRVSTIVPDIDPRLDDIIARALERDPTRRFQTAQEMRDALEAYIAGSGRFVRQEDIAQFIHSLFKNRRERVRRQVQASMRAANEADSPLQLPPLSNKGEIGMSSVSRTASLTGSLGLPPPATRTIRSEINKPVATATPRRIVHYAIAGFVVALLGTFSLLAGMKTRPAEPKVQSTSTPAATEVHAVVAPAPTPEPSAATDDRVTFEVVSDASPRKKAGRASHGSTHVAAPVPASAAAPATASPPVTKAVAADSESSVAATQLPRKRKFRTEF